VSSSVDDAESQFAKRLVTGLAAEKYFEAVRANIPEFRSCSLRNTTHLGCGYDFRLQPEPTGSFLAVEVKGMKARTGPVSFTNKEYEVAAAMKERYFLFVVTNFQELPSHQVIQNPLSSRLTFARVERMVVEVSWRADI